MAGSSEGHTEVQHLVHLVLALIAFIAGLVIHLFIIIVIINDWWKGGPVTPVDYVVLSLGFSRMSMQCVDIMFVFLDTIYLSNMLSLVSLAIMDAVYDFVNYANIWLTTLLSIIFCLKISNLQTRLFLHLRRMIVQRTIYFIVASVLLSAIFCFIPFSVTISEKTKGGTYNTTTDNLYTDFPNFNYFYNFTVGIFFPLLFFYMSTILLFTSLYHHTTRMKMSGNLTISLETYYSAMRFLSFTFIYNTMYFIGHFVCSFYYYFYCASLPWVYSFLGFLPALHSSFLIYRTAKLRNQMSKVLQKATGFLFHRKDTETRENIEVVVP